MTLFTKRSLRGLAAASALSLAAVAAPVQPSLAQGAAQAAPAALSAADRALVNQAAAYLQGLTAAQGRFVETGPRGQTVRGKYYLQRPGKMRFEYDAPSRLVVVSDGDNVKRYDPRLNAFQQAPLAATPLSVLLAKEVRLDRGVRVDRVVRHADGFSIVARDRARPQDGSVTLVFGSSPMRLKEWTISDPQGQRTRVQLTSLDRASNLASNLFVLRDPTRRTPRR